MKIFKMLSLATLLLLTVVACNNKNHGGSDEPSIGGWENLEQEWKLVSVDGVANDFSVYIKFESGIFALYQQVYTWDYKFFEGEYSIDGGVLSGSYFEGGEWKTSYTGGVSEDGKFLTLKSKENPSVTYIYEACTIPDEVYNEATATRALDVVPFL
jgi:hypothetical protein